MTIKKRAQRNIPQCCHYFITAIIIGIQNKNVFHSLQHSKIPVSSSLIYFDRQKNGPHLNQIMCHWLFIFIFLFVSTFQSINDWRISREMYQFRKIQAKNCSFYTLNSQITNKIMQNGYNYNSLNAPWTIWILPPHSVWFILRKYFFVLWKFTEKSTDFLGNLRNLIKGK